jgi:hypothetical protein
MRNARHETEHQARKYYWDAIACMGRLLALGSLPSFPPWRDAGPSLPNQARASV